MKTLRLGSKSIGPDAPAFVMAEAGVNHNAKPELALRLVEEAAAAGVDAVKFQTYTARRLVTRTAPKYYVDTMAQWLKGEPPTGFQSDEFSQLDGLPEASYRAVRDLCRERGILFLSTPFDEESADFLDSLGMEAFKIASGDITHHRLLRHIARKGKPILLSTGCSWLGEIEEALEVIRGEGRCDVALLHCTLSYPTAAKDVNLNMMRTLQRAFPDVPVGLSDHSLGTVASVVAVAHGARLIEKHFTLDKSLGVSTDHFMSVDPAELKRMIHDIREAEAMMGGAEKRPVESETLARRFARRSVVAARDIPSGGIIASEDLTLKRPGTGLAPKHLDRVVGRRANREIPADTVVTWEMIG